MANKSISQLDTAPNITINDLIEVAIPDVGSATGYISKKDSFGNVADAFLNDFTQSALTTTADTVVGAINEVSAKAEMKYPTAETKIGTWIDGKPVYRKSFYAGQFSSSSAETLVDVTSLNIDTVVRTYGTFHGAFWGPLPYVDPATIISCIALFVYDNGTTNNYVVRRYSANYEVGSDVYLTIEYTKTTDVAPV